jgi:2-iminobutanoate/2-iminopropanoate deaminase
MKKIIQTADAPEPIGPYSQGVLINNMLFVSGQVAINPKTNEVETTNITDETKQVMINIGAILKAAGMNYSHIVKTSIFLMDMGNFSSVNAAYSTFFEKDFPAKRRSRCRGCLRM